GAARHAPPPAPPRAAFGTPPDTSRPRPSAAPANRRAAMPRPEWSDQRDRQYEHIKEGLLDRGEREETADEIAARTVNKERARHGESETASRVSIEDISSGRRGGLRSHRGPGGRTKAQLYNEARERNIRGRSKMTKEQLARAVGR